MKLSIDNTAFFVLYETGELILLPMQYGILQNIGEIPFVNNVTDG